MKKHYSAHYYTHEFIYILFSQNKKNSWVSRKIFLFLELNVTFCSVFGQSQNILIELPYTNCIIILKQPTKAHIPVPFILMLLKT